MTIILSLVFVYLLKYGLLVIIVVACSSRSVCSSRIGLLWYGVFSVYDAFCLCGCSENRMLIRWPGNVACVVCCRIRNSEIRHFNSTKYERLMTMYSLNDYFYIVVLIGTFRFVCWHQFQIHRYTMLFY